MYLPFFSVRAETVSVPFYRLQAVRQVMLEKSPSPAPRGFERFRHPHTCLQAAEFCGNLEKRLHFIAKKVFHPGVLAHVFPDHLYLRGKGLGYIDIDFRLEIHPGGSIHEIHGRN